MFVTLIRNMTLLFLLLAINLNTATAQEPTEQQRFTALENSLTGATLDGHFTDSNDAETSLRAERYELKKVQHVKGDLWLFQARIKYGEHDVTLPLTLPVRWAGDTPIVSIDKFTIPGLGTYTARVMFYDDHYAGFWSGATHGGHLFGKIKRNEKDAAPEEPVKK
jgi:hypothetical protein